MGRRNATSSECAYTGTLPGLGSTGGIGGDVGVGDEPGRQASGGPHTSLRCSSVGGRRADERCGCAQKHMQPGSRRRRFCGHERVGAPSVPASSCLRRAQTRDASDPP